MTGDDLERSGSARRFANRLVGPGVAVLILFWAMGLVGFVITLPQPGSSGAIEADGIVALTGGSDRLLVAMDLLNDNSANRLLISGVHTDTTRDDLKNRIGQPQDRFDCCVDLDRNARNTIGNAVHTAIWAKGHGYRSLIVVTASYHMPRSLLEFHHQMPGHTLVPYAVVPSHIEMERWWSRPETVRLLVSEYVKYQVSWLRISISNLTAQLA